ncbi:hypothetical protein [Halobaculum sp. EA56]|uniref:hypothetical protein n=1 Tax=Halobaculum sp. EA56 TaxID=3421648 RepID=UPI003EBB3FAA
MSTSTHSSTASPVPRVQPGNAFDELIFFSRSTCSECFAHLRDIEHVAVEHGAVGTRERTLAFPTANAVRGYVSDRRATEPKTFCRECGSESGRALDRTLSQREAVERAHRLADRLDAMDVPAVEDVLVHAVRRLKSDERIQGYDREIFARATKLAIQYAQR